jgi:O-antigen/teichoic acid export membrane protein
LAPINEQVYSPSYSRLIYAQNAQLLFRRIFQMILITLAASIPCVTCIFLFGEPFLNFIHKAAFKDSFVFLPALLAYRILSMTVTGFSYSILCMNRFKALGILYLTSSLVAGIGYLLLRQNLILRVWCLPLATVTLGFLSCAYIIWLIRSKHPLLRRAMHTTV